MQHNIKRIFIYKPYWLYLLADIIILAISVFVVLQWFPLATPIPWQKYDFFIAGFALLWILTGYAAHRYVSVKNLKLLNHILRLLATTAIVYVCFYIYIFYLSDNYSIRVFSSILFAVALFNLLVLVVSYAYMYALNIETPIEHKEDDGKLHTVRYPAGKVAEESVADINKTITDTHSEHLLEFLSSYIDLYSTNTCIMSTTDIFNFRSVEYYRYDAMLNLRRLNDIRGINKMFGILNDKLPDKGLIVCCFEPKSVRKKHILSKYPVGLNYVIYIIHFIFKRIIPKMFTTSRLYYDITNGKNRVLSKAEVLGRLCYCGFEIVDDKKIGDKIYVVARESFRPITVRKRIYGVFIKLRRVGKNGRFFNVYKMRTMHPYSEFLQSYIYEKNRLQEGGKFNHDIRITTLGHIMRRYWIDELPMLINLLKGDMKLVGVRPISQHYFSLYSKELQEKRVKFRPGLLPPFYADMPKTLPEIEASEMKYLNACEQNGVLKTDFIYLWKIVGNILFKKARSK